MAWSYEHRIEVARAAVDYLTSHNAEEMASPVPNCPGWTVYNAAVHVGRVSVAWEEMIECTPDDATARERAYATSGEHPTGAKPEELARWAHSAIDRMIGQVEVTDPEKFAQYGAQVPATIEQYGGRYLVRGGETKAVEGDFVDGYIPS